MMSEYELQFQADLEKAQALSLESLAFEQFRRRKITTGEDNGREVANSSRRPDSEPPPALPPPPRKPARGRPSTADNPVRSSGTSPSRDDSSDLISFSSPTSKVAPKDPHADFIEQITKLGQKTEELALTPDQPKTMNNQHYNHRPGYPPTPTYPPNYGYNYQQHYPVPPYPTTPYGMPSPMTGYPPYYMTPPPPDPNSPYPAYPSVPYNQTRMATPPPFHPPPHSPYPTQVVTPSYNYSTTNMITRPIRPLYPNLSQMHTYPPQPNNAQSGINNVAHNNNNQAVVKTEPSRDSVESNASRKSSAVSVGSNESADVLGSLPQSLNLIDFGRGASAASDYAVVASECSSSVYEEYDPLDFLYGETEMRDTPVYATISKREITMLPSPPPKSIPSVPTLTKRTPSTTYLPAN